MATKNGVFLQCFTLLCVFDSEPRAGFYQNLKKKEENAIYSMMALLVASATARTGRRETCSGRSTPEPSYVMVHY